MDRNNDEKTNQRRKTKSKHNSKISDINSKNRDVVSKKKNKLISNKGQIKKIQASNGMEIEKKKESKDYKMNKGRTSNEENINRSKETQHVASQKIERKKREGTSLKAESRTLYGLEKYMQEYNDSFVDMTKLKEEVEKTLSAYEKHMKEEKNKARAPVVPDEDGWIEVKSKKHKDFAIGDAEKKMNKKAKRDNLVNFYSFEIRENKLKRLKELQEKFNEDKKRLALVRPTRKFIYK